MFMEDTKHDPQIFIKQKKDLFQKNALCMLTSGTNTYCNQYCKKLPLCVLIAFFVTILTRVILTSTSDTQRVKYIKCGTESGVHIAV